MKDAYFSMGKDADSSNSDYGCTGMPRKDHQTTTIVLEVFPNTIAGLAVWSGTANLDRAWSIHLIDGYGKYDHPDYIYRQIRLVRQRE